MNRLIGCSLIVCWMMVTHSPLAMASELEKGKELYDELCSSCHTDQAESKFGPGLKGLFERRSEYWVNDFIRSPIEMIKNGDEEALKLQKENKYGITMPAFPAMEDYQNRDAVIQYMKTM